jgi:hypothetical protein
MQARFDKGAARQSVTVNWGMHPQRVRRSQSTRLCPLGMPFFLCFLSIDTRATGLYLLDS